MSQCETILESNEKIRSTNQMMTRLLPGMEYSRI